VSTPARRLAMPRPHGSETPAGAGGAGAHRRAQRVDGAKRPPRSQPRRAPTPSRRRKHDLGFALFASTLVGLTVFAIVVVHVLLAQQSFRIDEAERRIEVLGQDHLELVRERATLSAPGRIAVWANRHGMRLPDDIRILRAPNGHDDPIGADGLPEGSA